MQSIGMKKLLIYSILILLAYSNSFAQEVIEDFSKFPKRKHGLWVTQVKSMPAGVEGAGKIEICITKGTEQNLYKARTEMLKQMGNCEKSKLYFKDKKIYSSLNCTMPMIGKMSIKTVDSGDFNKEIITTTTTTYDKPLPGMKKQEVKTDTSRWTGACKPSNASRTKGKIKMGGELSEMMTIDIK